MGVEPTSTGLQPVAVPSGSSVSKSPAQVDGRRSLLVSQSSDLGSRRQKRPDLRQHFLKRLPLPHGQRSLRPSFSSSSLSPFTIRTPRLACVSDGNPFRRLLIVSKKTAVRRSYLWTWDTSIRDADQNRKCPSQESNLVYELRGLACESGTLQGHVAVQYLARESNPVLRFRRPPCVHHTRKACCQ